MAHLKITITIILLHLVMTKLVVYRFCVLNKWSNPGHFLVYFHSFQTIFSRKKLQASAGYELGLSAWKTSTLTTRPPMRPLCMCCSIRFLIFRSELIIETFQIWSWARRFARRVRRIVTTLRNALQTSRASASCR